MLLKIISKLEKFNCLLKYRSKSEKGGENSLFFSLSFFKFSFSLAFFNEENDPSQYSILIAYNTVKCHCTTTLLQNLWKNKYQEVKPLKSPSKYFFLPMKLVIMK